MLYQGVVQLIILCKTLGHEAVALFLVQTALLVSLGLHLDFSNRFILSSSKIGILTSHKFSIFLLLEVLVYLQHGCCCHIQAASCLFLCWLTDLL